MGDLKKPTGYPSQDGGFCRGLLWTLSALTVICSLVVVNYVQFNEILNLRVNLRDQKDNIAAIDVRIKHLESGVSIYL